MSAELEQRDVTGSGLPEVRPEAADDVGARGVAVLQDLDGERSRGDMVLQVLVEEVDVVEASVEGLDVRPIVVDSHEQRVDPVRHGRLIMSPGVRRAIDRGGGLRAGAGHDEADIDGA